ncbi:DNA-binding transcriptional LysR family regulator [Kribbella sp. VKM Ac-2571]|uniref:LysR family transcriptional regulator n=1 Tax=Kribbella sp. VKM Ac-2571 TaxID=2512222 RepID=UPI00105B8223|nr:LysR family transcriptional regulator [Kribbella sp. VKM Ac-2571]TDO46073.1 DNA-binding transcriptional LysR family regulator [Kribbella sp. VKM Ac-2571]
MIPEVELREVRLFLVLAEELHFGRAAERLGLTTSRVSQSLRVLERKLGGDLLFHRTSRVVSLTVAGRELYAELDPAVTGLDRVLRRAQARGRGPGVVRVGLLNFASGVGVLSRAIERYEAVYAGAKVQLTTTPFDDRLGPLRRREIDLVMTRLPLDQPDIAVGSVLSTDKRVVMVGRTHPLAGRTDVTTEDLVGHDVRRPHGVPAELAEPTCPARTPSGRLIRFVEAPVDDNAELLYLLARGQLVHPTVVPFAQHFQHPDVVAVPLRDLPPSICALAGLKDADSPARDAFSTIVEAVLETT